MYSLRCWYAGFGTRHNPPARAMIHFSRRIPGKRPVSAEFLYLLIVVAAAVVTAYWAARTIGIDLSIIENSASALGIDGSVARTRQVGYSEPRVEAMPAPSAPHCRAGEQPAYLNGMAALHQQIGAAMGTPLECEHTDGAVGNTVQQTSAGLAAYDRQRNTETFTDGWHHWALTPDGLVAWEGTSAEPPPASASPEGAVADDQDGGPPQAVIVDSDGAASDSVPANQEDALSDAAAIANDDGAPDAVVADTQDDSSSQTAAASGDDGTSDAATQSETGDQP